MSDEELVVDEHEWRRSDAAEARAWASAGEDPAFQHQAADLEQAYQSADSEVWPS